MKDRPVTNVNRIRISEYFSESISPVYEANEGLLFLGDAIELLNKVKCESIDTVFADPPFNLNKTYGKQTNDKKGEEEYLVWCKEWLNQCSRVLKVGGSLFVYNLPKWNMLLGAYLYEIGMQFRHSIAIDMKSTLPIQGRLYPSHYSLIYFSKGKPSTFRKIRTPIEVCRHCGGELRDYGGHRNAMNPNGVNLKDVWTDIPPVRHWKFKSRKRKANALSTKVLDRVVEMSTVPGDIVLDPFGGSGTTFDVCRRKGRRWVGFEIEKEYVEIIVERLVKDSIEPHQNNDFIEENVPKVSKGQKPKISKLEAAE